MSGEDKQKHKECIKAYKRNHFNNVLKKIKDSNELKRAEVYVLTNFIKDEVESFSNADVHTDDGDSERDRVHWIQIKCMQIATKYQQCEMELSGILKTQLKKIFFPQNEYNMNKEFLKVGDVEIEKQGFDSPKNSNQCR